MVRRCPHQKQNGIRMTTALPEVRKNEDGRSRTISDELELEEDSGVRCVEVDHTTGSKAVRSQVYRPERYTYLSEDGFLSLDHNASGRSSVLALAPSRVTDRDSVNADDLSTIASTLSEKGRSPSMAAEQDSTQLRENPYLGCMMQWLIWTLWVVGRLFGTIYVGYADIWARAFKVTSRSVDSQNRDTKYFATALPRACVVASFWASMVGRWYGSDKQDGPGESGGGAASSTLCASISKYQKYNQHVSIVSGCRPTILELRDIQTMDISVEDERLSPIPVAGSSVDSNEESKGGEARRLPPDELGRVAKNMEPREAAYEIQFSTVTTQIRIIRHTPLKYRWFHSTGSHPVKFPPEFPPQASLAIWCGAPWYDATNVDMEAAST
ncbi:hypothetical protein BKA93DRAFT_747049 [Sparassis latifolia]